MVNASGVEFSDSSEQIDPQRPGFLFTKLEFVREHVVIEILTVLEVLSDDIVVGFGLEEVYYADHLLDLACLLQRQHFGLVLLEGLLTCLHFEFVHLLQCELLPCFFVLG